MKIVITHGYSDSNKGDLAIVYGTVFGLRKVYPDALIILHSVFSESDPDFLYHSRFMTKIGVIVKEGVMPSPYIDSSGHTLLRNASAMFRLCGSAIGLISYKLGIAPYFSTKQASACDDICSADLVIAKGGQYIYNDQGGVRAFLYLWRMLKIISFSCDNCKVVLLGHSIGPLNDRYARWMVNKCLSKCSKVLVRERLSYDLLSSLQLTNVQLSPDMAFLIEPENPSEVLSMPAGDLIGVTVVNWTFPGSESCDEQREDYLEALTDVLSNAYSRYGLIPVLFPQVTIRHHGESDMDMLVKLQERLSLKMVKSVLITQDLSPAELSYLYGKCKLLLGTRLHSCILAACNSCPVIAIRYQGFKTEGIMSDLGLSDYVHDINSLDALDIMRSVNAIMSGHHSISEAIEQRVSGYRALLLDSIVKL